MRRFKSFFILLVSLLTMSEALAQRSIDDMQLLTVNENITTVITASEPVRFVDISTDKVVGDKPIDNTIRLKPIAGAAENKEGDLLGVVTIVTERYRSQYALVYTSKMEEAVTEKTITVDERMDYHNPAVNMSVREMAGFARRIWNSSAKYRNVSTKQHRMTMRLNNIFCVGDYFFLDFSVFNRTNIPFDIDQLRITLKDKKTTKSTVVQTLELKPELIYDSSSSFRRGYRNVVVIKKLTFPNDKILTIELSEKQISGRTISMNIEYEEVLAADSFDRVLFNEE